MAKKFESVFRELITDKKDILTEFRDIHDLFIQDRKKYRAKFNEIGEKAMDAIKIYEQRLCGRSEGSGYSFATSKLSEKFWAEIRKIFPEIDEVGIIE